MRLKRTCISSWYRFEIAVAAAGAGPPAGMERLNGKMEVRSAAGWGADSDFRYRFFVLKEALT